jgi:hypothetical protein
MSNTLTKAVIEKYLAEGAMVLQGYFYKTIFNTKKKASLVVLNSDGSKTLVECREQNVQGTTDEKLPYLALSMQSALNTDNITKAIIVYAGSAFRQEALDWITTSTKVQIQAFSYGDI